jgi:hypothetical protein
MSCRSTSSGSVFITYSRLENGSLLSDSACLSLFHELRREYRSLPEVRQPQFAQGDYLLLLSDMRQRLETQPGLSRARRRSLMARLDEAAVEATPGPEMLYALSIVRERISQRSEMLHRFIEEMARRTRASHDETLARFRELESATPRQRTHRASAPALHQNAPDIDRYELGREQGVVYAATQLLKEARDIEMTLFRQRRQRISRRPYDAEVEMPGTGLTLISAGYDPRNGRLELGVRGEDSGTKTLLYRRVPRDVWDSLNPSATAAADAAQVWSRVVRGVKHFEYGSAYEAARDGVAPRCPLCGEFAATQHTCPVVEQPTDFHTWTTRSRWSNQVVPTRRLVPTPEGESDAEYSFQDTTATISLPAMRELRNALQDGPIRIRDISYRHSQSYQGRLGYGIRTFTTTGDVVVWREEEADSISVNLSELRCGCPEYEENYACQHTRDVERAILDRLNAAGAFRTNAALRRDEEMLRRAQRRAEEAASSDWTRSPERLADAERSWRPNAEVVYSRDFAAFKTVLEEAKSSVEGNGAPRIPYYTENALDGASQRGSGTAFGLEIEYEFPEEWTTEERVAANARIAARLHEAGLTWSSRVEPAQSSKGRGFRDRQKEPSGEGNWTLEKDGSVNGGELISPGLYDETETWTNLQTAITILGEEGAIASKRAGLHVHVGTADFNADPLAYTALARLISQHEDVIYRLSADPIRGTHRKGRFARPIPEVPPEGFQDAAELSRWQGPGKYWLANFNMVRGGPHDHPEFRVYDSTLMPGAIQAQVKMSLGLTEAAKRLAQQPPDLREKEPLGSHSARRAGRRTRRAMSDEELALDTATTRSFLDTLFRRREDKDHLIAIFAHTKWAK